MRTALIAGILATGTDIAAPTSQPERRAPTDPFQVAKNEADYRKTPARQEASAK